MARGGSHNNKGSRGRSYGLMLLLAFGAALFGVMVLHKLRERRIFSLLVKEKDHQLSSLHLLLQKEKEHRKEMKRKAEEMKGKIYSLRTQKMELDRRLIEMQSTIDSLKDEHKAMESAMEEKQNEIKMQREATDLGKDNSQLTALQERLMQKEAEIEDLKRQLEYPAKVLSVSRDDPLNPAENLTITLNVTEKDRADGSSSEEDSGWLNMSTNSMADDNSTRVENRNESSTADTNSRELIVEQIQKVESSQDKGFKNGSVVGGRLGDQEKENDSQEQDGSASAMREQKIIANSTTDPIIVDRGHVLERRDKNSDVKSENGHSTLRKPENSQDGKQEVQVISEGGMKLELLDTRFQLRSRLRRHGRLPRTKGKRWRTHAKDSDSGNNEVVSMSSRRFYRLGERENRASKEGIEEREGKPTGKNPRKEMKATDSTDVKLPKVGTLEDSEYLKNRDVNADPNQQVEQANEMLKSNDLRKEMKVNIDKVNVEVTNITSYANKQKLDEVRQPKEEASDTHQNMGSRYNNEQENKSMQRDDNPEVEEVADKNEWETEATDDNALKENASSLEEDEEEYKADIDDSEF